MSERRFTVQTEPRGASTVKAILPNDDSKSVISNLNASTNGGEHRQSIPNFRRLSITMGQSRNSSMSLQTNNPKPNTYRMEPENDKRFRPYKLQPKLLEALAHQLKDSKYDPATVGELVKNVTAAIHQVVKQAPLPRYKIVVETTITQKLEQLVRSSSRCLWNPKTDNMVSVHYENKDMVVVVTVYGVYCE